MWRYHQLKVRSHTNDRADASGSLQNQGLRAPRSLKDRSRAHIFSASVGITQDPDTALDPVPEPAGAHCFRAFSSLPEAHIVR